MYRKKLPHTGVVCTVGTFNQSDITRSSPVLKGVVRRPSVPPDLILGVERCCCLPYGTVVKATIQHPSCIVHVSYSIEITGRQFFFMYTFEIFALDNDDFCRNMVQVNIKENLEYEKVIP